MNENLNLVEILNDCPKGTKLYCTLCGEVIFEGIDDSSYPINVNNGDSEITLTKDGKFWSDYPQGECLLFPSKNQRDWSKFNVKNIKFDLKTLNPFDKVLVKQEDFTLWSVDLFSFMVDKDIKCVGGYFNRCIPYNEDTKHLVGTIEDAPEFYRYWEE